MEKRKYYLAYGSNLNIPQMRRRCPGATIVGAATIPDYQLLFRGGLRGAYLTIEPNPGFSVPAGVWLVTAADEKRLDVYEGFPAFYRKECKRVAVKPLEGESAPKTVDAFVYVMNRTQALGFPSPDYMQTCREGYEAFSFDYEPLDDALTESSLAENGGLIT